MEKIIITEQQKQILLDHAENEKPNESCAILFGTENENIANVEKIFLTKNIEESPLNFTISPEQRLEADKIERETGLKIVAIFHSHPNSEAEPSNTDRKFMELNPEVWIIFSGISKQFRSFTLEKEILIEIN
ncbi:MAG: peptidase [Nitrososphaeria archaeon]|nr:peptidase [Nitrosopumilaceae archaeon]NIP09048.1 peptidase [Nitrosopumilaceae archaeon]NIP91417.1 peptidase [Nitrososphaeria archaeon]NIS95244.1 peptidase [Nitrosopumilaceae archaeon]